jgi:hypothetical protein
MEASGVFEISVNIYQTAWREVAENGNLKERCRKLKYYKSKFF